MPTFPVSYFRTLTCLPLTSFCMSATTPEVSATTSRSSGKFLSLLIHFLSTNSFGLAMIERSPLNRHPNHCWSGYRFSRSMGIRIRIQGLDDQKLYNFTVDKNLNFFKNQKLQYFDARPPWMTSKLPEKPPARKREHKLFKTWSFLSSFFIVWRSFLPSWIRIRFQPTKFNTDPCGSEYGSTTGFGSVWSPWSFSWYFQLNKVKY